jgi:acyl-CoA reductase-like NAD-dependent aldehyde dehydrogenase
VNSIDSAGMVFKTWSYTKPRFRRQIRRRAPQLFRDRKDELVMCGNEVALAEKYPGLNMMDEMLEGLALKLGSIQGSVHSLLEGRSAIDFREPFGVLLGTAP